MITRPLALACLASTIAVASPASALEVWVSAESGSDENAGTAEAPFASLQRGCDAETADDELVVHLGPGNYREFVQVTRAGTHIVVDPADEGFAVVTGSEPSSSLTWTLGDPAGLPAAAAGQIWWADLSSWEFPPQIVTQRLPDESLVRLPFAREPDWTVSTEWKWHEHWETASVPLRYFADEEPSAEMSAHYLSAPFLQQWGDLTGARVWIKDGVSGHDTYAAGIIGH